MYVCSKLHIIYIYRLYRTRHLATLWCDIILNLHREQISTVNFTITLLSILDLYYL